MKMEGGGPAKKRRACDFDFLADRIPQRDVRELVSRHLDPFDVEMLRCAYDPERGLALGLSAFVYHCLQRRYAQLLEWALAQNGGVAPAFWDSNPYSAAAESGSIEMLRWVKAHYPDATSKLARMTFSRASECDYLDVLDWLENEGVQLANLSSVSAATRGFVGVLRKLPGMRGFPIYIQECMKAAAGAGHINVMEFLSVDLGARVQ